MEVLGTTEPRWAPVGGVLLDKWRRAFIIAGAGSAEKQARRQFIGAAAPIIGIPV
jgi:hypothetical protein